MTKRELRELIGRVRSNKYLMRSETDYIIKALEEVQKYRTIEKDLKERYHANVDIPLLMHHFIETVFEGEKHEGFCLLTNEDAKAWEEYKAIGTPEECQKSVEICKSMIERNITPENMEEYMKFEDECVKDGFTFNSLLEAREKQTAKKIEIFNGQASCPNCKYLFGGMDVIKKLIAWDMPYCKECGQLLDWRNEE